MDLKPTTIILLIDFEGHPILGDDFTNNQRFSTLAWLLNAIREKPLVIVSDHIPGQHRKTEEVAKITRIEKRNIWLTIDPRECSIERIVDEVHRKGYNFKNVIIGGTNTSGCVIRSKPYSAISWAKQGFTVQVLSSMCADYQITGVNATEQTQNALTVAWKDIQQSKLFDKISYIRDYECQII